MMLPEINMELLRARENLDEICVAVIIPAYNAERTLAQTLSSVVAQTHTNLDIVVVDDGSTDGTCKIAEKFALADPRVRLVRRPNGGVARARNTGVAATTAKFLAPVDADDIWHPEKIARQLAVMQAGGARMGFVYAPCRFIDANGHVLYNASVANFEGWAFLRHLSVNFVGNGSAMLIRRAAFEEVGGYDTRLQDAGCQGTEDYLLQILIARRWRVGLVPEYLVGYRKTRDAMSMDFFRMARSHVASLEIVSERHPETPRWLLHELRAYYEMDVLLGSLKRGRFRMALTSLGAVIVTSPFAASCRFLDKMRDKLSRIRGEHFSITTRPDYFSMQPHEGKHPYQHSAVIRRQLRWSEMHEGPPEDYSEVDCRQVSAV